jgi:hypothetical protein
MRVEIRRRCSASDSAQRCSRPRRGPGGKREEGRRPYTVRAALACAGRHLLMMSLLRRILWMLYVYGLGCKTGRIRRRAASSLLTSAAGNTYALGGTSAHGARALKTDRMGKA